MHRSTIIPLIQERLDEAHAEFFRVQAVPHDDYFDLQEKKKMLKDIQERMISLNFDLRILQTARSEYSGR